MNSKIQFQENLMIPYKGQMIYCMVEQGRRFWAYKSNDVWSLRQEFCSAEEAMNYIDEKEI